MPPKVDLCVKKKGVCVCFDEKEEWGYINKICKYVNISRNAQNAKYHTHIVKISFHFLNRNGTFEKTRTLSCCLFTSCRKR